MFYLCGIDQKAPLDIRETCALSNQRCLALSRWLRQHLIFSEVLCLSTCHRTEIYGYHPNNDIDEQTLIQALGLSAQAFQQYGYFFRDVDAVSHLMRVASGLESTILGEPEILGQVKKAYQLSEGSGSIGRYFSHLFSEVFLTSKHIRHQTRIGRCPVSFAHVLLKKIRQYHADLAACRVVLVGSGQMAELVASYFADQSVADMVVLSRRWDHAHQLASTVGARVAPWALLQDEIMNADILVTATASETPLLTYQMVTDMMSQRPAKSLFIGDLAVPRDVAPRVAEVEAVYLYDIDQLSQCVDENRRSRERAKGEAEALVHLHASRYFKQLRLLESGDVIRQFRQQSEQLRDQVLEKGLQQLQDGLDAEQVLYKMAHELTQKLLHQPTVLLREQIGTPAENAVLESVE